MWEQITKPNAGCRLYLVGEAASAHHGWIVGALESVIRATHSMFLSLQQGDPECKLYGQVVELLTKGPGENPPPSPFYPLPKELPKRQWNTPRGTKQTNDPTSDIPLTHSAATASLALIESFIELVAQEGA